MINCPWLLVAKAKTRGWRKLTGWRIDIKSISEAAREALAQLADETSAPNWDTCPAYCRPWQQRWNSAAMAARVMTRSSCCCCGKSLTVFTATSPKNAEPSARPSWTTRHLDAPLWRPKWRIVAPIAQRRCLGFQAPPTTYHLGSWT